MQNSLYGSGKSAADVAARRLLLEKGDKFISPSDPGLAIIMRAVDYLNRGLFLVGPSSVANWEVTRG